MKAKRPTALRIADALIGMGVWMPVAAFFWFWINDADDDPTTHATNGPIIIAITGAVLVLYGVILYAGRHRDE